MGHGQTGHVSTGAGQACSPTLRHRVASTYGDDRDCRGSLHHGDAGFGATGDNDVGTRLDKLARQHRHLVAASIGGPPLDDDVTPFHVTQLNQPARKGAFDLGIPRHNKEADARSPGLPLGPSRQRCGEG